MARIGSRRFSFSRRFSWVGSLIVGSLFIGTAPASAVTFGFDCITNNMAGDCAIGEAQTSVDVTDAGAGQIAFTFRNVGAAASSITDVYWDDGTLASLFSISGSAGVNFSDGADPSNLPGGNDVVPPFVATFSADSNAPVPQNGVNPGETLTVTFVLVGGQTFADAITALNDGSLRVGIHVQGFASGGSEGLILVPEPGTFALLGTGLLALAIRRRRRG